ncbi:MAG TPA: glycoside hydrolase family 125 protein [Candidatus Limnocylindria bacterium]|jgi:hypothetical protein|nr:glycoside hydrolase family 125 protein [Candidatus Limnocylindria bacterium]
MDGRGERLGAPELTRAEPLDSGKPYKPLDVGNGIVSGTVTPNGRWLSLGITHPVHGRVELTTAQAFTGDRYEQAAVRAYRASLAEAARLSFGFDLLDDQPTTVDLIEGSFPHAVVERAQGRFEVITVAPTGRAGAVQILRLTARGHIDGPSWGGALRLARAEYTQLTRGGALPPAPSANVSDIEGALYWIDDRALGASAAFAQSPPIVMDPGDEATVVLAVALAADRDAAIREAVDLARDGAALVERELDARRRLWAWLQLADESRRAIRRGVSYPLDCAAARARKGVAILADHQILPLVWTRDAYYVCRALLAVGPREPRVVTLVEDFIRWTFEVAERVDGWWPRASLASGQAKDPAFQLDQQLFPLLLLLDHMRLTRTSEVSRYEHSGMETLDALLAKRSTAGLIATAETPADDPLAQPFHFSSHVLLWRVLDAFHHRAAGEVRDATLRHFTSEGRFAYAIAGPDGADARHYHDANDFPTVFAPGWGFVGADDPRWRATIDFAWSDRNEAYFGGALSGLGSAHTPHPWPLGDLQEIIVARVTGDPKRERRARERLERVETWDGMLPEAYDEMSGAVVSRHWFAWPAALRALLEREPMLTAP